MNKFKYYKFRRGNVFHWSVKTDKRRTWTVCGKIRFTHRLIEIEEKVVLANLDLSCTLCVLGMTGRAFDSFRQEVVVDQILHSPAIQKRMVQDLIKQLDIISEIDRPETIDKVCKDVENYGNNKTTSKRSRY